MRGKTFGSENNIRALSQSFAPTRLSPVFYQKKQTIYREYKRYILFLVILVTFHMTLIISYLSKTKESAVTSLFSHVASLQNITAQLQNILKLRQ